MIFCHPKKNICRQVFIQTDSFALSFIFANDQIYDSEGFFFYFQNF